MKFMAKGKEQGVDRVYIKGLKDRIAKLQKKPWLVYLPNTN